MSVSSKPHGGATATTHRIRLTVNGRVHERAVEARRHLADLLRQDLGLTGTHVGCEHGACGACTVIVDGAPLRACLMFAVQADGASVTTVEGLARPDGTLHPLQEAFRDRHGLQCGFCTPGMLMTLVAFLGQNPDADEPAVRDAISGNLCRCTGYESIVDAALDYAREVRSDSPRHREVRAKRASNDDGPDAPPSFEARPAAEHLRMTGQFGPRNTRERS